MTTTFHSEGRPTNPQRFMRWLTGSYGYENDADYVADIHELFSSEAGFRVLAFWVATTRGGVLPAEIGRSLNATEQVLVQHAVLEFVNAIIMTLEKAHE